eukprot:14794417-Alexandrium_andersonii.AAC.1
MNADELPDFEYKVSKAWACFWKLKGVLSHKGSPVEERLRLLDKAVPATFLWAAELRRPTIDLVRKTRYLQRQMMRLVFPIGRSPDED